VKEMERVAQSRDSINRLVSNNIVANVCGEKRNILYVMGQPFCSLSFLGKSKSKTQNQKPGGRRTPELM
jgi:hypothetical protein